MNVNFIYLITYFIVYSILGWLLESIFRSVCEKRLINSGFLYGPFCPIYGFGAIIMISFLYNINNIVLLFIVSLLLLTVWEYIVGVWLEKIFKTKYWDYSNKKIQFQGRICLVNSIYWGILGVIFVKVVHPFMLNIVESVNMIFLIIAILLIMLVLMIDSIISIVKTAKIEKSLDKVHLLNEEIKKKLYELKNMDSKSKENIQAVVDKLNKERERTIRRLYRFVLKMKRAFPTVNTKAINEILEIKNDIKNKIKKGK